VPAIALALAIGIALGVARPAQALRPNRPILSTPSMAEIVNENVTFPTSDGLTLRGWFLPFQDQSKRAIPTPGPIIILPSDGSDNRGSVLWHYYMTLLGTPWHVLTFDWRGFGDSSNWDIDTTQVVIPEFITDLKAAVEYAKTRPECNGRVGILAYGPATAVALAAVASGADVDAMVLRGVYTRQADYCAGRQAAKPPVPCTPNARWPALMEPVVAAGHVTTPVLLVVGEKDEVTPPAMAETIRKALAGKTELWRAPGAGHTGFDSPEYRYTRQFAVKMHEFFKLHMGAIAP
jgi:pimeloyl-ACP methyl ester carboxylesterase